MSNQASQSFWRAAGKRLWRDNLAKFCIFVLLVYFTVALLAKVGLVASEWNKGVGVSWANPSFMADTPNPFGKNSQMKADDEPMDAASLALDPLASYTGKIDEAAKAYPAVVENRAWSLPIGGDKWGRDVLDKVIKGGEVSITVGVMAALLAVTIGTVLGAISGYFGRTIGDILEWFYNIFTAMPYFLLVLAIAGAMGTKGISTVIIVLGLTGWTSVYRLVRAEYIKQRSREYVQAADAIGASQSRMMFIHILPNVSHLVLVQLSQLVIDFIKAEVVLSFLGFGVPLDSISWGVIINEVMVELVLGKWWQLAAVAVVMSTFVVCFGLFTDVLRDAFDPKANRR
ncbi:ABC transporter permease [Chitinimonas arctica]|uniref:ABC transporter permease n=1 Tax=Chitinimonas arctica TaxID=2594795 RepID=A0A516SAM7_9NEIS|nr:ABC transporter permease [Chitinimonas arctica]QDQ25203.1 ABC transporter permease [Chitinimonas arctica]